jgi:hypothetical protein
MIIIILIYNRSETLNIPDKRTASGGMVDGDLENGRSERVDDCNAILCRLEETNK